ncbi:MAG: hypothetical protein H7X77_00465 [Anaerolineae bacterium]|nr:hypothetical protein [Anaerolineae bacterium]
MKTMIRTSGLALLLLLILSLAAPAFARQADLDQTYTDDFITFDYPEDWFTCTCPEDHNTMAIGNTEEAPSTDDLQRDEVQVLVIKSVAIWIEENLEIEFDADTPEDVLVDYFAGDDVDVDDFDGREYAFMFTENDEARMETLFIAVELGDGNMGMMVATTRPRDLRQFEDTLFAIAETLVATESNPKSDRTNSDEIELTEDIEMEDGDLALSYPDGWLADEGDTSIIIVSDEEIFDIEELADIPDGEVAIFVYPTVEALGDYPMEVDNGTRASTIVSYYASLAMANGLEQHGAMETPEIGDGEFEASSAYSTLDGEYDQFILTIENGDDDFITLIAYAAPGDLEDFIPTLEAIAATFSTR